MNMTKANVETEFHEIDSKGAWPLLFQHIRNECLNYDYTCSEAKKSENKNLNRYRDVSPYDHSRVVLGKGACDYINANLVTVDQTHRRYILTQGPLPHTAGHFWLMVWEQNCKAVLMLNRVIEKNQVKCHQYWPLGKEADNGEDTMLFTDVGLKVQYVSHNKASYYTTRTLRLTQLDSESSSRDILHFHYTHWPDFGVPQSPTAFLHFLMVVRQSGALDQNVGPPVVHCSAGIGRSGTFCLVDSCLMLIEENGIDAVNVRELLMEMRTYRMGLIQTPDQLRFSYVAIIEGAKRQSQNNDNMNDFEELSTLDNHSKNDEADEEDEDEEPPPLPPPRGASLTTSLLQNNHGQISGSDSSLDDSPLDKPLPVEPYSTDSRPLPSIPTGSEDEGSFKTSSPPSSPDSKTTLLPNSETVVNNVRQRKLDRQERQERVARQVRDMKRKQHVAESWQKVKRSISNPFNIGVGLVILLGGGALAYSYFTRV